jgi:hypothetical protein
MMKTIDDYGFELGDCMKAKGTEDFYFDHQKATEILRQFQNECYERAGLLKVDNSTWETLRKDMYGHPVYYNEAGEIYPKLLIENLKSKDSR